MLIYIHLVPVRMFSRNGASLLDTTRSWFHIQSEHFMSPVDRLCWSWSSWSRHSI